MHQKLVPDPFLILVNNPKQALHARNFFDYQKAFKKSTLFFHLNSAPLNRTNYQKQKKPGTSDQLFFRLRNKFRKIPLLAINYLTKFDDVVLRGF